METDTEKLTETLTLNTSRKDEDGYITLWRLAEDSLGYVRSAQTIRELASRLLNFLCKHRYPYVLVVGHDADFLDEQAERDEAAFFNWSGDSDKVDLIAQYIKVPAEPLARFLKEKGFNAAESYSARRATRQEWFKDDWKVE
jgi:hypothetical protein